MTSTIHIFDEYQGLVETLSDSERHKKRIDLEKLVYSTLKSKYSTALKKAWDSWNPPTGSNKTIVIIERRIHENLEFILHNAAWAGQEGGWGVTIVCSDLNLPYIRAIVGTKHIQILPLFQGNPTPQQGKEEYNRLLQSSKFFEMFEEEYLIFVEMDCYFRKQIPDTLMTCDYVAAPYAWDGKTAGGGLSFRRKSIMLEICKAFPEPLPAADIFASNGINALGYSMPPLLYSKDIFAESILDADPVGVHQWWTFFSPDLEDSQAIFDRFMTIEIP